MEIVPWLKNIELYVTVAFIFTVLRTVKQPVDVSPSLEMCYFRNVARLHMETYIPKGTVNWPVSDF